MTIRLLRLVAHQMKVGIPLPFDVQDQERKLLLGAGHVLDDELHTMLMERGFYADVIDQRLQLDRATQAAINGAPVAAPGERRQSLFDLWRVAVTRLRKLYESLPANAEFERHCHEFALQLMQLVRRDPDVAIYVSMRQNPQDMPVYGLTHALHTAMICMLMGSRLGWDEKRIHTLVLAALTMNLSIWELQGRMATMGRLTDAQRQEIQRHPEQSIEMLLKAGIKDSDWLLAIAQHHERPDGTGYPLGVKELDELGWALGLADVFMAKISPREKRAPLSIQEAARQMYQEANGSPIAAAIIKEYGIYPPGDFVQLASGELAVVIRRGAIAHTPIAAAITDSRGIPVISTTRRDTSQPAWAIVAKPTDRHLLERLPPERVYGLV